MVFVGSLALLGFPFLTGFYSKDVILEVAYASYSVPGHFAHWLGTLAAFFTAFYSIRLLHLTFLGTPRGYRRVVVSVHDAPVLIAFPLFILCLCSIFAGYLLRDLFIGVGTCFWQNSLFTHPHRLLLLESEFIPHFIKLVPVGFSVVGALLSFYWYSWDVAFLYFIKVSRIGRNFYTFFNRKWFFDKVFNEFITQTLLHYGYFYTYKVVDRGLVEMFGPFGITSLLYGFSQKVSVFQTGYIYHYTLVILSGVAFPLAILFVYYTCTFYFFSIFGKLLLLFFVTMFSLLFV
jgi:NADH-ubiquinone oxidoreductase chain 5